MGDSVKLWGSKVLSLFWAQVIPLLTIFNEIESYKKGTLYFSKAYFIVSNNW